MWMNKYSKENYWYFNSRGFLIQNYIELLFAFYKDIKINTLYKKVYLICV